ncbi:MAG TPA: PA2169 family four-helix-bundle protein [Solimonas sp.]|nr:PA2169 family four-helix-bundle protein [Solimonas sp.]
MTDLDTITAFNELIETSKDGERNFRAAAEEAYHPELKSFLKDRAQDCARSAQELQDAVRALGGRPEEIGTTGATVRRGWMHLKALALGRDEIAILDECERYEDAVEARYEHALGVEMPDRMHALVERQYEGMRQHHSEMRGMRERFAH